MYVKSCSVLGKSRIHILCRKPVILRLTVLFQYHHSKYQESTQNKNLVPHSSHFIND